MSDPFDTAMSALGANAAPAPASPPTVAAPQPAQGSVDYSPVIEQAARTHNVDPNLLRAVMATESGGNPKAVSPKGATGLMQIDPSNYKALGITNPTDPAQNINGGAALLSTLLDRYKDVPTALTHYVGGDNPNQWGPQTHAYPQKVLANYQRLPASAPQAPAPAAPTPQQQAAPAADAFDSAMSSLQQSPGAAPAPGAPAAPASRLARFGQAAAGLADTILSAPGALAQQGDYAVRRAFQQSPQQAQAASQNDFGGATHPVGNAFGVTNTPGYQAEPTQRLQQAVGGVVNKGVNAVASATGAAPQDVANMAGSAAMLVPGAAKAVSRFTGEAAAATATDELGAQVAARAPQMAPWEQAKATYGPGAMAPRTMVGGGAASSNLNPYPQFTGEETARGAFPQVKTSKIAQDVTSEEQAARANVVNQIMGENAGQARTGVVTGNENTLRDEVAAANSPNPTPASMAMKRQLVDEQNALSQYAEERVNATGASPNILTNDERGRVINDAIYGPDASLTSYLRDAKQTIYDTARATQGNNPIQTAHVDSLFADPQFQAGVRLRGNEGALSGAQDLINLARTTGFRDPVTGEMYAPGSVAAWDAVRKSLNSNWSPANAGTIRAINGAIDQDTAAAGGNEMYKLGDRIHQVEKTLLDSKGIGSVLGEYDANGIKTGASLESIPAKLNSMPIDQWQHIRDTLDDLSRGQVRGAPEGMPAVPNEVQQAAAGARAEMDGALARSVYEAGGSKAGVWNQNAANKVLNSSVGDKIMRNFPPDEAASFHTLNYGGQFMPGVHAYEGAGQQLARLNRPGFIERFAPNAGASAGAAIGAALPIPGASWLGAAAGERAGAGVSKLAGGRRTAQQLGAVTEEMRHNARLGEEAGGVPLNSLLRNARGNK